MSSAVEVPENVTATAISAPEAGTDSHMAHSVAAINDEEATRSVEASGLVERKDMDVEVDGPGKKEAYGMWSRFNSNDCTYKD